MHIEIHKITDIKIFSKLITCLADCRRNIDVHFEDDSYSLSIDLEDTDELKIKYAYANFYIGDTTVVIPKLKFWYMEIS